MAQQLKIVASIPALDAADDPVTNSFIFSTTASAVPPSNFGAILTHVQNFYNVAGTGGTNPLAYYISDAMDRGTGHCTTTAYDITSHLDGTPHGSPVASSTFTLGAPVSTTVNMPVGVAACVNFQRSYGTDVEFGPSSSIPTPPDIIADYGAASTHTGHTRPRSRDRGRWYIGPLNAQPFQKDSTTHSPEFTSAFITDVLAACFNLSGDVTDGASNIWVLQQWSRRSASVGLITEFWMDNRPDYQRRRSDSRPGARTYRASQAA